MAKDRLSPQLLRLIDSSNQKARSAQVSAAGFYFIGLLLLAFAFSTSDLDLVRNTAESLGALNVPIPVIGGFALASLVFVALHGFTLIRYDMLDQDLETYRDMIDRATLRDHDGAIIRQLTPRHLAPEGAAAHPLKFRFALATRAFAEGSNDDTACNAAIACAMDTLLPARPAGSARPGIDVAAAGLTADRAPLPALCRPARKTTIRPAAHVATPHPAAGTGARSASMEHGR